MVLLNLETDQSIGTLSCWNLGGRIRSREYQYFLHTINCSEKDDVMAALWKQHTEEMMLIEGSVLHIIGQKITVEYQPSADQAWQFWANNELTQSATYPSIFAKVHKGELNVIGGTLGVGPDFTWRVPTMQSRNDDLEKLSKFCSTLKPQSSKEVNHKKKLNFMANNGLRQLGEPRIGLYCDRQRPEPMHLEINNWEHVLNLIYRESMTRGATNKMIKILQNSVSNGGCGLQFVANDIRLHFECEKTRDNKLSTRLIGAQAILLAKNSLRIIVTPDQSKFEIYVLSALSKICETLRSIGTQINRNEVTNNHINKLEEMCNLYFNLFALFFREYCQSTV